MADAERERLIPANPMQAGLAAGRATRDRIARVRLSLAALPLPNPISDAKVLTGRQKPLTEVAMLFAEITSEEGLVGLGFSYSKRAGGPGLFAHAREICDNLIGEDPNDTARLHEKLCWAGASVGRSGIAIQAIAAMDIALWDMKAKRADLPLAKLLGAYRDGVRCYNTSSGFLSSPIDEVKEKIDIALAKGIEGIKIKVGQPDPMIDIERLEAVRAHIGGSRPLMIDANQQWDRVTALRFGRIVEPLNLEWIEEPLDAYDAQGHADLARELATPIATGEMLASAAEHAELIRLNSVDFIQPDAPRVGGITPFLKICALASEKRMRLAPHFAMEIHLHLSAAYPHEPWVEHFEWLEPLFNERLEISDGRMWVPDRPGLGLTLSDQARAWTSATHEAKK
ncbi:mandelate racemase/muconate lactonizing enzyme family protein [Acuticoccus sp. MNP-M23]|uniref:L-talarate/galactarate dehydratase n=1 Tax=Acuticoccus sp. MNP-M23 TaxID=3072793 RepID=UPI002816127F|nr:mandelate racemase/muconate lactonizing enzyme family protein [Acuticoccus sp. MNP-M23]WMS42603.1 mandelate racemase/muconate lactonizing enzyme family protein [Acuticoccus sp. MNP-M23]